MTPGIALQQAIARRSAGDAAGAVEILRRLAEAQPACIEAWGRLGDLWRDLGRLEDAVSASEAALSLKPDDVDGHLFLGNARHDLGWLDGAAASWGRALAVDGARADLHCNSCQVFRSLRRFALAEVHGRTAITLNPGLAEAYNNLGLALWEQGRLEAADILYRRALAIRPQLAGAALNRAAALQSMGRIDETLACYETLIAIAPDFSHAHRCLLAAILYHPAMEPEALFAAHRRFEESHARRHYGQIRPHSPLHDPDRRLRVGYLSSDLRNHPVARNLLPVLRHHDRSRFELYFYAELTQPDAVTAEFQSLADGWRWCVGRTDAAVAEMIRADGIDILVCLAGRFDHNRPLVCAFRPAPIQISWYDGATSGLEVMDYLFSDRVLTPRATAERFTERLLCLPGFYVADMPPDLPPVRPRAGGVAFGCLNNPAKVTAVVLDLWARLLAGIPDSTLLLQYRNWYDAPTLRGRVQAALDRHGVDPARVVFAATGDIAAPYLDIYNQIDIALDPFPFSGSTTTFEALVMGVPVVSLRGRTMMANWSAAMLTHLGLGGFVAETPDDYLTIAKSLAADEERRRVLRQDLRGRVAASSLCDGAGRARQIERFYRAVWKRYSAPSESDVGDKDVTDAR